MSDTPYIDADKIAEVQDFLCNGGDEERAAAYLQCRVEDLPQLLGHPQGKREPVKAAADATFDLWRSDELDSKL